MKMKTLANKKSFSAIFFSLTMLATSTLAATEITTLGTDDHASTTQASASNYNYRSHTNPVDTNTSTYLTSFKQSASERLSGIKVIDFSLLTPNTSQRKNSIFEFAAIFNDKLQQLIDLFSFVESKETSSQLEDLSKKNQLKKIKLSREVRAKLNVASASSKCKSARS